MTTMSAAANAAATASATMGSAGAGWLDAFRNGLMESVAVPRALLFYLTSARVRSQAMRCALLNVVLFAGSAALFDRGLKPILAMLLYDATALQTLFALLYRLLWLYPVYALSFLLNTLWYQDIADQAFLLDGGARPKKPFTWPRFLRAVSEEAYRLLLLFAFLVQASLLALLPWIGPIIMLPQLAFLYSFYYFEYKWVPLGWNLEKRIAYFESRWPYFLGFGLPTALMTVLYPTFVSYGILAFLFPNMVMLAIVAQPTLHVHLKHEASARISRCTQSKGVKVLKKGVNMCLYSEKNEI